MSEVNYTRVNWKAGSSGGTPLSPNNLNIMDKGIADCASATNELNQSLANIGGITTSVANTVACKHITTTQISSISLSGGTYLIIGSCLFPYAAGGSGDRRVLITESLTEGVTQENTNAVSANNNSYSTIIEKSRLVYVDRGTTKIFLLCAFQASGADMDVSGRMRIVRLA